MSGSRSRHTFRRKPDANFMLRRQPSGPVVRCSSTRTEERLQCRADANSWSPWGAPPLALLSDTGVEAPRRAASRTQVPLVGAPDRLGPLGVGLFTLPKSLEKDFDGTLGMLSGLGYKEVELFGPYPFSTDAAKAGWAATSKTLGFNGSGFFGRTARQVRESLDRYGPTSPSMHVDFDTLRDRTEQIGEAARELGGATPASPPFRRTAGARLTTTAAWPMS